MDEEEIKKLVTGVVNEARRQDKSLRDEETSEAKKNSVVTDTKDTNEETFNCPECDQVVSARQKFCPGCGSELEWGE